MISSFFSKTKPINYVVLSVFLVLFIGFYQIWIGLDANLLNGDLIRTFALVALVGEMFLANTIVRNEKVADFSSYPMLFFVLLLVVFPESTLDNNMVFCNFLLLLVFWRLLSVKTIKNVKHKIFDASFFIGIASLFVDWAILYLLLVFLVINLYDRATVKNWFIPLIAIGTVAILAFTIALLNDSVSFFEEHYRFSMDFLKDNLNLLGMIKPAVYVFITLVVMVLVFLKLRQKGGGKLLALRVLFFGYLLSVTIMMFSNTEASSSVLGFFPAAIFFTNYLGTFKQNRYKEIAVVVLLLIPFLILGIELRG